MPILTKEGLAGIRLLVCMAKADGVLKSEERFTLEDALAGLTLPDELTVEKLLAEENDPLTLAKEIASPEGRDYTYAGVFALAYCDQELSASEEKLLCTLRELWGIHRDEEQHLAKALDQSIANEKLSGKPQSAIADEGARDAAFGKLLRRYSLLTGLTGAIPIPLVPDLLVVPLQVKMVYDIAGLYGQKTDKHAIQLMFETLGVGTGARLGISFLCKMVPVWGSMVGAASSYATTYALGKVAYAYFKSEGSASIESLKPMFRKEHEAGKQEYEKHRAALDEAQKHHAEELKQLAYELQQGKITHDEYERRIDGLK